MFVIESPLVFFRIFGDDLTPSFIFYYKQTLNLEKMLHCLKYFLMHTYELYFDKKTLTF